LPSISERKFQDRLSSKYQFVGIDKTVDINSFLDDPLRDLDNTHHPGHVVKERIESVALENAFLNGKIAALTVRSVHTPALRPP